MADLAAEMRRALIDLDIEHARRVSAAANPHLVVPLKDEAVLQTLHLARTATEGIPFRFRAYSHRWLTERALPSMLPDMLKPSAERLYPRVVDAVGISVASKYPVVADNIRGAMEYVVNDCYANGDNDPLIVRPLMLEARHKEKRALGLLRRGE